MYRVPVSSKILKTIGYDPNRLLLEVKFRITGKVYAFYDITKEEFLRLISARSVGNYFNTHIKTRFQSMEVK
ncbi:MAG: KTSC domain-containing protein [Cytophagaceae bacterium]